MQNNIQNEREQEIDVNGPVIEYKLFKLRHYRYKD